MMIPQEIVKLLAKGENDRVEFKTSFNTEVIETLVAFSNTHGGKVLIWISDNLAISGVSINTESVQNWLNEIKTKTSPDLIPEAEIIEVKTKKIVVFSIQEYPIKPVSFRGKYFKRVENANHILSTHEVVNMHLQTFNTSWDYHINNQFTVDDISFEKVQFAIDRLNQGAELLKTL